MEYPIFQNKLLDIIFKEQLQENHYNHRPRYFYIAFCIDLLYLQFIYDCLLRFCVQYVLACTRCTALTEMSHPYSKPVPLFQLEQSIVHIKMKPSDVVRLETG